MTKLTFLNDIDSRTKPLLIALEDADGEEIEVVAKFSASGGIGVEGLAREAICAILATDLSLPVPRPYFVRIDQAYIDTVSLVDPKVAEVLTASNAIGFGSRFLGACYSAWMKDRNIPDSMHQTALEIFAFDQFIANPDRRPENPNLLSKSERFAIIDHELAMLTEGVIGWQNPWVDGALDNSECIDQHVLGQGLRGKPIDLDRLVGAWEALSDDRLAQYISTMPTDWPDSQAIAEKMCQYLAELRDNIESATNQVRKVLL